MNTPSTTCNFQIVTKQSEIYQLVIRKNNHIIPTISVSHSYSTLREIPTFYHDPHHSSRPCSCSLLCHLRDRQRRLLHRWNPRSRPHRWWRKSGISGQGGLPRFRRPGLSRTEPRQVRLRVPGRAEGWQSPHGRDGSPARWRRACQHDPSCQVRL